MRAWPLRTRCWHRRLLLLMLLHMGLRASVLLVLLVLLHMAMWLVLLHPRMLLVLLPTSMW